LTSIEGEHEKSKSTGRQNQQLETIRTLLHTGRITEATVALDDVMKASGFDVLDLQAYTLADEIRSARKAQTSSYTIASNGSESQASTLAEPLPPPSQDTVAANPDAAKQELPAPEVATESTIRIESGSTSIAAVLTQERIDRATRLLARYIGPIAVVMA